MSTFFHLSPVSRNVKTGPIPVSTTSSNTCPGKCPFKGSGCYAESGPLALHWRAVNGGKGATLADFAKAIRKLPKGQLWRHNQAGDLPGQGDLIETDSLAAIVAANKGRNGFTYTHKPMDLKSNRAAIVDANRQGFTVNLSANNPADADRLADLGIAPVVTVLPVDQLTAMKTPKGRTIAICPAVLSEQVTCASCGICQQVNRKAIIGFPAHGNGKRKAAAIASL